MFISFKKYAPVVYTIYFDEFIERLRTKKIIFWEIYYPQIEFRIGLSCLRKTKTYSVCFEKNANHRTLQHLNWFRRFIRFTLVHQLPEIGSD